MESTIRTLLPGWTLGWQKPRAICNLATCHNRLLVGRIPSLSPGIMLDDKWYCSVACFAAGAASRIAALSSVRVIHREHRPRLSAALILVAKGDLAETQLGLISGEAKANGETSEEAILRLGLATKKQMTSARATQWGCSVLGHDHVAIPIAVDLPLELLRACSAVPLHYARDRKQLLLGVVQRPHHDFLQAIEKITGCRPEVCFITKEEFYQQFDLLQSPTDYACDSSLQNATAARAGRALAAYALDIAAQETRFSLCCNAIWVRVVGRRGIRDMILPAASILGCESAHPAASFSRTRLESSPPAADSTSTWRENATRNLFRRLRVKPYYRNRTGTTIKV